MIMEDGLFGNVKAKTNYASLIKPKTDSTMIPLIKEKSYA